MAANFCEECGTAFAHTLHPDLDTARRELASSGPLEVGDQVQLWFLLAHPYWNRYEISASAIEDQDWPLDALAWAIGTENDFDVDARDIARVHLGVLDGDDGPSSGNVSGTFEVIAAHVARTPPSWLHDLPSVSSLLPAGVVRDVWGQLQEGHAVTSGIWTPQALGLPKGTAELIGRNTEQLTARPDLWMIGRQIGEADVETILGLAVEYVGRDDPRARAAPLYLAAWSQCPPAVLALLATHDAPAIRRCVLRNPQGTPEVKAALALNPLSDEEVSDLWSWDDADVDDQVASIIETIEEDGLLWYESGDILQVGSVAMSEVSDPLIGEVERAILAETLSSQLPKVLAELHQGQLLEFLANQEPLGRLDVTTRFELWP